MQIWKIDSDGIFTGESEIINEKDFDKKLMTIIPLLIGYVKPKFDGTQWVEDATGIEIKEWGNSQFVNFKPSETDLLMLAIAELDIQRIIDKTETQMAIAELASTLLGGV